MIQWWYMSKKIYLSILLGIVSGLLTYFSGMNQNNLVLISSVSITIFTLLANWYLYKSNKKIIYVFLLTGILLYLLEILGANTGIVYGEFVYSSLWQPALLGTPIIMAFVWATLVVESLFIVRQVYMRPFVQIITASIFLVMLDLVIDPGAIHLGLWNWVNGGPWYGVPYSNYIGWLVLGIVGASVYYKFTKNTYVKIYFNSLALL